MNPGMKRRCKSSTGTLKDNLDEKEVNKNSPWMTEQDLIRNKNWTVITSCNCSQISPVFQQFVKTLSKLRFIRGCCNEIAYISNLFYKNMWLPLIYCKQSQFSWDCVPFDYFNSVTPTYPQNHTIFFTYGPYFQIASLRKYSPEKRIDFVQKYTKIWAVINVVNQRRLSENLSTA